MKTQAPASVEKRHWLNLTRVRAYARIVLALHVTLAMAWIGRSTEMLDANGKPLGADFILFWAASHLGLNGSPADAYVVETLHAAQQLAVPGLQVVYAWVYPPTFFLLVLPLALMPYAVSLCAFLGATLAGFLLSLRSVVGHEEYRWCVAAFPGVWCNVFNGQNAFLTASIAGAACLLLDRRPILAGALASLLVIKPQLGLLFPVALLAARAWKPFAAAAIGACALVLASTLVLGLDTIGAYSSSIADARRYMEEGAIPWQKMPTVFAGMRLLGVPVSVAYAAQAIASAGAAWAVWTVWRRSADVRHRGASLMSATFLASPYAFDYDLAWLALPIAWSVSSGLRDGWLRGEREVLLCAWLLPLFAGPIADLTSVQIAPIVFAAMLSITLRRTAPAILPAASTDSLSPQAPRPAPD